MRGKAKRPTGRARYPGFALLALLMWVLVPVVPLPVSTAGEGRTTAALTAVGEVALWASAVILGREVLRRYQSYPGPRHLSRKPQ